MSIVIYVTKCFFICTHVVRYIHLYDYGGDNYGIRII